MTAALAAGALVCGWIAPRAHAESVIVAVLPPDTTLEELARIDGLSLGTMSTGIGEVPAEQTYLDITQGSRASGALYDESLPSAHGFDDFIQTHLGQVPAWGAIVSRAERVPADLIPGLLAGALHEDGIRVRVERGVTDPALLAVNRQGVLHWLQPALYPCRDPLCQGLTVLNETRANARKLIGRLRGDDLLVALVRPSGGDRLIPIGIAGRGFAGNLTSDSTRTDGYVLSTDISPTIFERFGLDVPDAMDGEPIRSEGNIDVAAVSDLADRMAVIPDRREPLLAACLAAWILIAFAVNRIVFGLRRVAIAWLALAFAYMPLTLLLGARLEPGAVVEGLLVGLGSALLAGLTVRFAWGWRGPAIACGITVGAYAIDVIAGSGLTRLSLLGPNPLYGARFYGIGNELEALFAVMVPVAVGAGLSAYTGWGRAEPRQGRDVTRRAAVAAFLVAGAVTAIVFGAGRFGADVGAAIVLPVGAVVAAAVVATDFEHFAPNTGVNRSKLFWAALVIASPMVCLALLAVIDLVSGSDAHLTRSVIEAGGATNLSDAVQRRLELSAHDFGQAAGNPLFWIVVVGMALALSQWRRINGWLTQAPMARAGLIGACAAVAVGVLVNDSGATFLALGALALGAFLAYAWSQAGGFDSQAREISSSRRNT